MEYDSREKFHVFNATMDCSSLHNDHLDVHAPLQREGSLAEGQRLLEVGRNRCVSKSGALGEAVDLLIIPLIQSQDHAFWRSCSSDSRHPNERGSIGTKSRSSGRIVRSGRIHAEETADNTGPGGVCRLVEQSGQIPEEEDNTAQLDLASRQTGDVEKHPCN